MADPTPLQNRSKRPLSPSAASPPRDRTRFAPYSNLPLSNTPKPSPIDAPAAREKMLDLDWDQRETLLKTLFDLHPSARESIAAILPSITSAPSSANAVSQSVYFGEQVAWWHEYLNNHNWPLNPRMPATGSCEGAGSILNDVAGIFENHFDSMYYVHRLAPVPDCDKAVLSMDATIALFEIGRMAFERRREAGMDHELTCRPMRQQTEDRICEVEASFSWLRELWIRWMLPRRPEGIADGIHPERSASPEDDDSSEEPASPEEVANYLAEWEAWHIAIRYLTRDNQSHPLRETLLKFIDLPPILPHPGPNDNAIPESDDWLRPCLEKLALDIVKGEMPDRRPGPVLDLGGMSIN